jgi:hypothetical protein
MRSARHKTGRSQAAAANGGSNNDRAASAYTKAETLPRPVIQTFMATTVLISYNSTPELGNYPFDVGNTM